MNTPNGTEMVVELQIIPAVAPAGSLGLEATALVNGQTTARVTVWAPQMPTMVELLRMFADAIAEKTGGIVTGPRGGV